MYINTSLMPAAKKRRIYIILYDTLLKYSTEDNLLLTVCEADIHIIQYIYVHCCSPGCSCKQFMTFVDAGAITNTLMEKRIITKGACARSHHVCQNHTVKRRYIVENFCVARFLHADMIG